MNNVITGNQNVTVTPFAINGKPNGCIHQQTKSHQLDRINGHKGRATIQNRSTEHFFSYLNKFRLIFTTGGKKRKSNLKVNNVIATVEDWIITQFKSYQKSSGGPIVGSHHIRSVLYTGILTLSLSGWTLRSPAKRADLHLFPSAA
jgi:hypothetical protein